MNKPRLFHTAKYIHPAYCTRFSMPALADAPALAPFIWSSWVLPPRRTFPGRAQSPGRRCGRRGRWGCWPCWAGRGTRSGGSAGTLWPPQEAAADCWSSRCTRALGTKSRVVLFSSICERIYFSEMLLERHVSGQKHRGHYFKSWEGKRTLHQVRNGFLILWSDVWVCRRLTRIINWKPFFYLWFCLSELFYTSLFWQSGRGRIDLAVTPQAPRFWRTGALKRSKTYILPCTR